MNQVLKKSKISWIRNFLKENLSDKIILNLSSDKWVIEYKSQKFILPFFSWLYIYPDKINISFNKLTVNKFLYKKYFLVQINKKDHRKEKNIYDYDYLGMIFWTLNLYEDKLIDRSKDEYGRFSASTSLAYKNKYLEYPYIEYILEFLRDKLMINELYKKSPQLNFSHDIDCPPNSLSLSNIKSCVKHFILHKDISPFLATFKNWLNIFFKQGISKYYLIEWLITAYKKNKLKAFFFVQSFDSKIVRHKHDCEYNISSSAFINLINRITTNNHSLGLHLSLLQNNLNNSIQKQIDNYKEIIPKLLIFKKSYYSNRAHFLQFENMHNYFDILIDNQIKDDYSIGFYDMPGFRVGTGNKYNLYHPNKIININPLICMEVSLTSYMKLGFSKKIEQHILLLAKRSYDFKSDFSILWHDNNLISKKQKNLFLSILKGLKKIYNNS